MSTSREDFEAWASTRLAVLSRTEDGDYVSYVVAFAWKAWQARDAEVESLKAEAAALRQRAEAAESSAARDVLAERARQINVEGWTLEYDDAHSYGEMALAASCYAQQGPEPCGVNDRRTPGRWPWARRWWKPSTYRRNLIKAGALILAEIERLDRIDAQRKEQQT